MRWGSSGGPRVLGLDGLQGLAPGMAADLAIWSLDDSRFFGLHDIAIGPIACVGRPRLKALYVAGNCVVEDDAIPGVDLRELAAQARAATKRLLAD